MAKCPHCGGYIKDSKATFESRSKQIKNVATGSLPEVSTANVHNYNTPSWPAIIVTGFVCYLALLPVGWGVGVFLLDRAGFREPDETLAGAILLFVVVGPVLVVGSWWVERVARSIIREVGGIQVQKEEIRAETARSQALTAGAPTLPAKRLTGEQMRFYENLALVMHKAYQDLADSRGAGYRGGSDMRPWSKRAVLAMDPPRYGKMPDSKATDIRKWLAENEVIIGNSQSDQINTGKYPTFADFQTLLAEKFNMPVVVRKAPSPTLRREVSFIEDL